MIWCSFDFYCTTQFYSIVLCLIRYIWIMLLYSSITYCSVLHSIPLCCTVRHCTAQRSPLLYYVILHRTTILRSCILSVFWNTYKSIASASFSPSPKGYSAQHYTALHCIALHWNLCHCIALYSLLSFPAHVCAALDGARWEVALSSVVDRFISVYSYFVVWTTASIALLPLSPSLSSSPSFLFSLFSLSSFSPCLFLILSLILLHILLLLHYLLLPY